MYRSFQRIALVFLRLPSTPYTIYVQSISKAFLKMKEWKDVSFGPNKMNWEMKISKIKAINAIEESFGKVSTYQEVDLGFDRGDLWATHLP